MPIIVTSQHLYEIDAIADQMIILDDGKCRFCGSLNEHVRQNATRIYENINLPKRLMQERLQPAGMTILETNTEGYIIETPTNVRPDEAMTSLTVTFGDRLFGIRDITCSSRRFFVDALSQAKRHRE